MRTALIRPFVQLSEAPEVSDVLAFSPQTVTQFASRLAFCGVLVAVLVLSGSPVKAQELSKSELFAEYKKAPSIAHLHCGNSVAEACRELVRGILFSDEKSEIAPTHVATDLSNPALQDLLGQCQLGESSGPLGASDEMYGPDPLFPRGPFKVFDLSFGSSNTSLARVLVVARGYQRQGADKDLGWVSYYMIAPEAPCSPTALEFHQGDENLRSVEAVIRRDHKVYLMTLFQQEKLGDYYSGRLIELSAERSETQISFAIVF
jgi:hypothetical protein